jgi:hypothetical protein
MTRFAIAAALATVAGLGFAGTADAQYYYRNTAITPGGGLVTTNQVYSPFGYQAQNIYVSPSGAVRRQYVTGDVFGNTYRFGNGFNPNTGYFYNRGFYNPSPYAYPYGGGYNYNFYRRW